MVAVLSRDKFYFMHMLRCKQCLNEWVEIKDTLSQDKKPTELERIVVANHQDSNIIR